MSATGRDVATGAAPRITKLSKPFPVKLVVFLTSGAFVSLLICAGILFLLFGGKPEKVNGTLRIDANKTKWSMGDKKAKPGNRHNVLVFIERVDFKGPVTVYLRERDLPTGIFSAPVTIPVSTDRIELPFTVSIGTDPVTKDVTLVAECEEAGARAELPMTLIVAEDPVKSKKK
jgi:hypothetical protein